MPDAGVRQHNIIIQKSSPGEYYTASTCGILPYVKQSLKDNNAPQAMHGFRGLEGAFCDAHTLSWIKTPQNQEKESDTAANSDTITHRQL